MAPEAVLAAPNKLTEESPNLITSHVSFRDESLFIHLLDVRHSGLSSEQLPRRKEQPPWFVVCIFT